MYVEIYVCAMHIVYLYIYLYIMYAFVANKFIHIRFHKTVTVTSGLILSYHHISINCSFNTYFYNFSGTFPHNCQYLVSNYYPIISLFTSFLHIYFIRRTSKIIPPVSLLLPYPQNPPFARPSNRMRD